MITNTLFETAPPFLDDENPAHPQYREAAELFALFGYLRAQRFGVFSIRESLQAVGECPDGTLQGFHLTPEECWETVRFVDSLGIGVVELPAYPANRPGQALNRQLIERARREGLSVEFAAHARCAADDVYAAHESGFRRIHLYIGASRIKQATAGVTVEQIAGKAFEAIRLARELGFSCVRISTEDAFRTTLEDFAGFYAHLARALREAPFPGGLRVDGIGIPDSVGISTLEQVGERIAVLQQVGIGFDFLECHIHNDTGNADRMYVDVLLLCMRMGLRMLPDLSILGIGERNGTIGLSSLLEAIYRRLILLYPHKMEQIRLAVREALGRLPDGTLFVNRYRDMDAFFYRILARIGFVFDRSPFSANTEFDGSGVHADTTHRAYRLALASGARGQEAVDRGNSAYAGALPPYDMPLRVPALACFGCGKSNVRYWREREGLTLRPAEEIRRRTAHLEEAAEFDFSAPLRETAVDELVARIIRCESIRRSGLTHHEAMEIVRLFYTERDP
ncbi:MAG: pyruvate carboxyltransferase [Chloroflexota bacterium]|nr:MAG: pyruvate carboxyltransferase [Chloroflexota bacterium]